VSTFTPHMSSRCQQVLSMIQRKRTDKLQHKLTYCLQTSTTNMYKQKSQVWLCRCQRTTSSPKKLPKQQFTTCNCHTLFNKKHRRSCFYTNATNTLQRKTLIQNLSQHLIGALFETVSTLGLPRVHHDCVTAWLSLRVSDTVTAFHRQVSELKICGNILSSDGRASRRGLKLLLSSLLGVDSCRHHYHFDTFTASRKLSNYHLHHQSIRIIFSQHHFFNIYLFTFL